jgi:hypothetical protein
MSTNAGPARRDLRYFRRLEKVMKGCAARNATLINPKRSSQHFAPERQKGLHQVALLILHLDIAEVIAKGVGNSRTREYPDLWYP